MSTFQARSECFREVTIEDLFDGVLVDVAQHKIFCDVWTTRQRSTVMSEDQSHEGLFAGLSIVFISFLVLKF